MRTFESGATRDDADDKPSFAGYLSVPALRAYGEYMLKHQRQANGEIRSADNWKKGMSRDVYLESLVRHVIDVMGEHEGSGSRDGMEEALCGVIFNAFGYLHEWLREESVSLAERLNGYTDHAIADSAPRVCSTCGRTQHDSVCHACGVSNNHTFWQPIKTGGTD